MQAPTIHLTATGDPPRASSALAVADRPLSLRADVVLSSSDPNKKTPRSRHLWTLVNRFLDDAS